MTTHSGGRQTKKPKGGAEEAPAAASPRAPKGGGSKTKKAQTSSTAMSNNAWNGMEQDPDNGHPNAGGRPSSAASAETSPPTVARDSSRRKSSRKKTKEASTGVNSKARAAADTMQEPSTSASASTSRKSKKGSKKDRDVQMKDVDGKQEELSKSTHEDIPRPDTGGGATGSDDPTRGFTAEQLETMEREDDDPFSTGYLSRLSGSGGLSSSLRALTGILSGTHSRLRNILEQLRTKSDPSVQLIALSELSELLLVSNEENLAGHFVPDQYVRELVILMQPNEVTKKENPEMMLLACRCIANMMEALPAATASVVYGGAVPILCKKLLEINYIDLAEQALSTLEKVSVEFPSSIVREGGLTACLTYLDFFATGTQRTAVTTAANCCRNLQEDNFPTVHDVMPIILNTLASSDQRVVEQASLCVSRIVDSFKYHDSKLEELVGPELLKAILRLLLPGSTNMIGPNIYTQFLRVLSIAARASPRLSVELLKLNVVDTLYQILTGVSPPAETEDAAVKIDKNVIMQAIIRIPRDQIFETLNVVCELLPDVARKDLTFMDDLPVGYGSLEHVSMPSRVSPASNDKRVELLKTCPEEVKRFTVILFPTLMHAYTSTVNLNVRQRVLTTQLKMLSNFDTDILEDSLQGVPYASHLASILTQQENPCLVTFALQAAELLLKRLGTIYRPQFYREGVIAEITRLAERPLQSEQPRQDSAKLHTDSEDAADPEMHHQLPGESAPAGWPDVAHSDVHRQRRREDGIGERDGRQHGARRHHADDDDDDDDDELHGDDDGDISDDSEPALPQHPFRTTDMQDVITRRAKRFLDASGDAESDKMRENGTRVLNDLNQLASELKSCYAGTGIGGGVALFRRLAKYFDGDALESITSYELMNSQIVEVLLNIFHDLDEGSTAEARADFLEVFMATANTSNLAIGDSSFPSTAFSVLIHKLQDLLSRAEHFEVVTVQQNAFENNRSGAASMLAKTIRLKLMAEEDSGIPAPYRNIQVSIHAIATFSALDTYLRPRVIRSKSSRRGDGFASAMAAYAAAMASRSERTGGPPPPPMLPGLSGPSGALPTRGGSKNAPKTHSSSSDQAASAGSSKQDENGGRLRRSSGRTSGQPANSQPVETSPAQPTQQGADQAMVQDALECADEEQLSDGADDEDVDAEIDAMVDELEDGALENGAPDPSAVNIEAGGSGKVTARTDDGARIGTPSGNTPAATPTARERTSASARLMAARELLAAQAAFGSSSRASYATAVQQPPQDWHLEFSVNGEVVSSDTTIYRACHFNTVSGNEFVRRNVWSSTHTINFKKVEGPAPTERSGLDVPTEQAVNENGMPPSLDKHPVTSSILRLMSILHDLNNHLNDVLVERKNSTELNAEPLTQFVNTKLTAKLNRQLEEPLIVASRCLPTWAEDLTRLYPFLFPFETRHQFLQSTSFGYSRSMARWQGSQSEHDSRRHRDDRPFLGRVQRQKVRISRSRILESAIKVMELYGSSSSILEVEYFEEVGTGLGPTLEFYSSVSKEFSKKKAKLWRENESSDDGDFAFGRRGLFPAPMSDEAANNENGQKILHLFKALGKFVARSMLDSRMIDISFNPTFFRTGDGKSAVTPSLGAVATVDNDLAQSLKMLRKFATAKQRIVEDPNLTPAQKVAKIEDIRVNDACVEDLGLDFTLPGYPHIELVASGSKINVTLDNVGEYVKKVIDYTLVSGVQRQVEAFRAGFSQVFPYSALKAFTPDELVMLFGRVNEDWSIATLMDSIKADHGFNLESKSVRNLLQTMSELSPQAKRDFLQFVTGSPKLPIGGASPRRRMLSRLRANIFAGFKSLTPMFTVVCRPSEPPFTPDDYLPSVMTCVNYLKMPDYSTLEMLKQRLDVATREGQGAFHLS